MRLPVLVLACSLIGASAPAADQFPARIQLIGAEIFTIDRSHSQLGFTVGFLGMTNVRGTFNDYEATILHDDIHPERSSVTIAINVASIDTNNEGRDKDLQRAAWFDAANHPQIIFQSTRIVKQARNRYLVYGTLTMKGVSREIVIPMERTVPRTADAGWGNIRVGAAGATKINRSDFGITGPEFWGKSLSDEIAIELDILGNRPNYDRWNFPKTEKPGIGELMSRTLSGESAKAAASQVRQLNRDRPSDYDFEPPQFGIVINRLMQHRKLADAVEILNAAIELHPHEWTFHARQGEALAALGDREGAIREYELASLLRAEGTEAKEMLRRLKVSKR